MDILNFNHIDSMLASRSPEADAAVIAFAAYISSHTLSSETSHIFQKILSYNNPAAVDALLKNRTPDSFFSTVKLSKSLVQFSFTTLSEYRYHELYQPVILVCLGILYNAYKNPHSGMSLYSFSVSELYQAAKYLIVENEEIESLLISFLENLAALSGGNQLSIVAGKIIDAHLDNSKKIDTIIPSSLLR